MYNFLISYLSKPKINNEKWRGALEKRAYQIEPEIKLNNDSYYKEIKSWLIKKGAIS